MGILLGILIFSILILVHEFGHFIFAKYFGVKVNQFAIGFGPTLFKKQGKETLYSVKLFPFGGFCELEGEDDTIDESNDRAMLNKPRWQQAIIAVAGPVFNLIFAFLLSCVFISCVGYVKPEIASVDDNSPAAEAGLLPGDEIIKINNYSVHFYQEVRTYLFFNKTKPVLLKYLRDGDVYTAEVLPVYDETLGSYAIGAKTHGVYEKCNAIDTLLYGAYNIKHEAVVTVKSVISLFSGQVSVKDMQGAIGIVDYVSDVYNEARVISLKQVFIQMLNLITLLSVNLAIMNLLPIPALDGGRIFIILIEKITMSRISKQVEAVLNSVGFVLLMILMIYLAIQDVIKLYV